MRQRVVGNGMHLSMTQNILKQHLPDLHQCIQSGQKHSTGCCAGEPSLAPG